MNLNPIFVTLFDHDGWPLCPKCEAHLRCSTYDPASVPKVMNLAAPDPFKLVVPILMRQPLECDQCGWITPRHLDPDKTINLAIVPSYIHPKWADMGHGLPRIYLQQAFFDTNPKDRHAKCWTMFYGYN